MAKQRRFGHDVHDAIDYDRRRADRLADLDLLRRRLLLAVREHPHVAVLGADQHFAVHPIRRAPDRRLQVLDPIGFAGLEVEAVDVPGQLTGVHQPVVDRDGGHGPAEDVVALTVGARVGAAVVPDLGRIGVGLGLGREDAAVRHQFWRDVARFAGRVDATQVADALEVLRVLARADDDLAVHDHRGGDEVALGALAAQLVFRVFGVTVELPEFLARARLEAIQVAVAAGEHHGRLAAEHPERRVGPLAVHDVVARRVRLPQQFAGLLVQRDERRRLGRRDVQVLGIDPVGRDDEQRVAHDRRRRRRHVVREDVNRVFHHVEAPDRVGVDFALVLFVGDADVLAVGQPGERDALDLAAVGHEVRPIALDQRRRAHALVSPNR